MFSSEMLGCFWVRFVSVGVCVCGRWNVVIRLYGVLFIVFLLSSRKKLIWNEF